MQVAILKDATSVKISYDTGDEPAGRRQPAEAKLEQWISSGGSLAWWIDGDAETVCVYRRNHAMKTHRGIAQLASEDPIDGFFLKLGVVWKGLR